MRYLSPVDAERIAFRHREWDINSYENELDNDLPCVGTIAWRTWRPFTRIGRAKRVGRHVLQATVLPYWKSSNSRRVAAQRAQAN